MGYNKTIMKISQDNPLVRYYLSLPSEIDRKVFRSRVVAKIDINVSTLYRWMRGRTVPTKLVAIALGEITGIAPAELYPQLFILDNIND